MSECAIRVENLSKIYRLYKSPKDRLKEALHPLRKKYHNDFYALHDINFEVQKGESVGIIGQNGSGKSTLLKIITGVLTPSSGNVTVKGRVSALLELGAGFNPELTGLENVYFNGAIIGFSKQEMDAKIDDILSFADIGEFVHQPVKTYSSGMFVRLAFAVATQVDPDILIVDEALSVGDVAFQAKCFNRFQEFREAGKTILFVTHSVDLIIKHCPRAAFLHHGKLLKYGNSKDTVEHFREKIVKTKPDREIASAYSDIADTKKTMKDRLPVHDNPITYGSLEAEIVDFGVINQDNKLTTQLYNGEDFSIAIHVRFHSDIENPIVAFTIKSPDGLELTGTNSANLNEKFGLVRKGENLKVIFTQKMVLNSGRYLLSLGCTKFDSDNLKIYHRLYDVVAIDVVATEIATGIAFSSARAEVERKNEWQN